MNAGQILNSKNSNEYYSTSESLIIEQMNAKFLSYLKDFYDYDEAILYTYKHIDSNTDISVIDKASYFVFSNKENDPVVVQSNIEFFKNRLLQSFKTIQIVCLTRRYERHSDHHYLFISSNFQNETFKIIIPMEFNYNILNIPLLDVSPDWRFPPNPSKPFLYVNSQQYVEFIVNFNLDNNLIIKSVCEINFHVERYSPILNPSLKNSKNSLNNRRQSQLVLTMNSNYSNNIDVELKYGEKNIKNGVIENPFKSSFNLITHLDNFIFPLAEPLSIVEKWGIVPKLSPEFMSQDFESYWLLKDMESI